jgi:hypothetical protein
MKSIIQGVEYEHEPIIDRCVGCDFVLEEREGHQICRGYLLPKAKWRPSPGALEGHCPMATHVELKSKDGQTEKKRVGQQKQKKH